MAVDTALERFLRDRGLVARSVYALIARVNSWGSWCQARRSAAVVGSRTDVAVVRKQALMAHAFEPDVRPVLSHPIRPLVSFTEQYEMYTRRTMILSMVSAGAAAFILSPSAKADDGCTELEACLAEIERVFEEDMSGDALAGFLVEAADEADPAGEGGDSSYAVESFDDPPKSPTLRAGQAGDLLKAVVADATVKKHMDSWKDKALEKVKADWDTLKIGEQIIAITFVAPVAASVVTSILKTPSLQKPAQDLINTAINGAVATKAPWLKLSVDIVSPAKVVTLQVDVMYLLRKAGVGF
jgi:hypothetical protein